jgi:hypothetical protein
MTGNEKITLMSPTRVLCTLIVVCDGSPTNFL